MADLSGKVPVTNRQITIQLSQVITEKNYYLREQCHAILVNLENTKEVLASMKTEKSCCSFVTNNHVEVH